MRRLRHLRLTASVTLLAAFAGLTTLAGCGSSISVSNTYVDVNGTVTLPDGKPLPRGMIHFEPVTPESGRDDQAVVENGKFTSKMAVAKYKVAFDIQGGNSSVPRQVPQVRHVRDHRRRQGRRPEGGDEVALSLLVIRCLLFGLRQ